MSSQIQGSILLLTPYEDCSVHKLAQHRDYLKVSLPIDVGFYQPLKQVFSKVILYDYLKRMVEVGVKGVNREIIDLVKKERPQYALWVVLGDYYEVQETTFNAIRQEGTGVIGWFFDDDTRFDVYSRYWVPFIDYFVTNDLGSVAKYREQGAWAARAILTGNAVDRDWSKPDEKYGVTFIGSLRADRAQYLKVLEDKKVPVSLFGVSWGKFVSHDEMMSIFGDSKINLNFSKSDEYGRVKPTIKARIFEVCLAGGFLLTEYFPGIETYFEIDKEIVCFRNAEEMLEKITYYLSHGEQRRAIARAGWKRATSEYTALQVMSKVFREIKAYSGAKRKPGQSRLPATMRRKASDFYCDWGIAFSLENYKGLSRDALALSLDYNRANMRAWYHYIISFFPRSIRLGTINLYRDVYRRFRTISKKT